MGYNIGLRLIEDFLAKSSAPACTNFREVAEMISKVTPQDHAKRARLTGRAGRLQDIPEHHTDDYELVERQQAVLAHL
jgi:hypothetical protein